MAGAALRAEARVKQLCCLGLGGQTVMPALLRELHAFLPSFGNTFFWADENGELANIYDESPDSVNVGPLYVNEFYNRREWEVNLGFTYTMRHHCGVHSSDSLMTVSRREFLGCDLYNLVFRPLRYQDFLRLMVREGGRALGALQLWRAPGERKFSQQDMTRLWRLGPYIAHALTQAGARDVPSVESEDSGVIVADRAGVVLYASRRARALLFYAMHPQVAPGKVGAHVGALPPAVRCLCDALVAVFEGRDPRGPPTCEIVNGWGRFTFRAHWLESAETPSALIGITVSHLEPLPLRLMRRMIDLPLTPRQMHACLLTASGLSARATAGHMEVSEHTAIAYRRQVYARMDVHNRSELLGKLLAL